MVRSGFISRAPRSGTGILIERQMKEVLLRNQGFDNITEACYCPEAKTAYILLVEKSVIDGGFPEDISRFR